MTKALFLALFALLCFVAFAAADADLDQTWGSVAVDGRFAFAGNWDSSPALNTSTIKISFKPLGDAEAAWPAGVEIKNIHIQFRKYACNCQIATFDVKPTANEATSVELMFPAPIEDSRMNFQAYVDYVDANGLLQIQAYTFNLQLQAATAEPISTEFSVEYRKHFAKVFSVSAARHKEAKTDVIPMYPELLLTAINMTQMETQPKYLKIAAIGRLQFNPANAANTYTCFVNQIAVKATVGGENLSSFALLDIEPVVAHLHDAQFLSITCDDELVLYPTNAVQHYKYDMSFFSLDLLAAGKYPLGYATLATLRNLPDVTPKSFIGEGYVDDNVFYCSYDIAYPSKDDFTGNEVVDLFFNGVTGDVNATKARVDLSPSVYDKENSKAVPLEAKLYKHVYGEDNAKFTGYAMYNTTLRTKSFDSKGSVNIKTFIPLPADFVAEDVLNLQCVAMITHPNTNKAFSGDSYAYAATTPAVLGALVTEIDVDTKLEKLDSNFKIHLTALQADLATVELALPMSNFIFDGKYAHCQATAVVNNQTLTEVLVGVNAQGNSTGRAETVLFTLNKSAVFKAGNDVVLECAEAKMTQKQPQYEFVHKSALFRVKATTVGNVELSATKVLPMVQDTKTLYIIYGIFAAIMLLAIATMVICSLRCLAATCSAKNQKKSGGYGQDSLLLNGDGYNLE